MFLVISCCPLFISVHVVKKKWEARKPASLFGIRIRIRMGALWYFSSMHALSFIIYSILGTRKIRENAKHIFMPDGFLFNREEILKYLKESLVSYRHYANITFFLGKYLILTAHNYCSKFVFITLNKCVTNFLMSPRAININTYEHDLIYIVGSLSVVVLG